MPRTHLLRGWTLSIALVSVLLLTSCDRGEDSTADTPDPGVSVVSGEPRGPSEDAAISALTVTPREPAVPFRASNGKTVAAYELTLTNTSPLELTPTKVEILDPRGEAVATLKGRRVAQAIALPSAREGNESLTDGQVATLYLAPEFEGPEDVPDSLEHRITVTADELPPGGLETAPAVVEVDKSIEVPVLAPPLEAGERYIAADSCCDSVRHRRALLSIGNEQFLAQRLAVDWEQVDATGRTVPRGGDPKDPEDYVIFGRSAIAATDGEVVLVVDGLEEQVPGALPDQIPLAEADGNSVVVDIGGGLYMMYAHMQPDSIEVAEGDSVERGDAIGKVGNTGNSSAPHLHFHVMDGPSPLKSEGVPYVIDSFRTDGEIRDTDDFDRFENTTTPLPIVASDSDGENSDELPLDRTLVSFD